MIHVQIVEDGQTEDDTGSPTYRQQMVKQLEERKKTVDKRLFTQLTEAFELRFMHPT